MEFQFFSKPKYIDTIMFQCQAILQFSPFLSFGKKMVGPPFSNTSKNNIFFRTMVFKTAAEKTSSRMERAVG
jgi:hypothetical protein